MKWIVMLEMSNRIEKDMDKGWRKTGRRQKRETDLRVQRIVISHVLELHTNDDITVLPPEVKERVDVDSLSVWGRTTESQTPERA